MVLEIQNMLEVQSAQSFSCNMDDRLLREVNVRAGVPTFNDRVYIEYNWKDKIQIF